MEKYLETLTLFLLRKWPEISIHFYSFFQWQKQASVVGCLQIFTVKFVANIRTLLKLFIRPPSGAELNLQL